MTLRKLFGLATLGALLAIPLHVAAQNGITSSPPPVPLSLSVQSSEKVVLTVGLAPLPSEEAVKNSVAAFGEVVLVLLDENGDLVADFSTLPRVTTPRGGFRSVRVSATDCAVDGDYCDLKVEVPDGMPYEYPDAVRRTFGRVIVISSVACETDPCGPGVSATVTVVGPDGDTRASTVPSGKTLFFPIVNVE